MLINGLDVISEDVFVFYVGIVLENDIYVLNGGCVLLVGVKGVIF